MCLTSLVVGQRPHSSPSTIVALEPPTPPPHQIKTKKLKHQSLSRAKSWIMFLMFLKPAWNVIIFWKVQGEAEAQRLMLLLGVEQHSQCSWRAYSNWFIAQLTIIMSENKTDITWENEWLFGPILDSFMCNIQTYCAVELSMNMCLFCFRNNLRKALKHTHSVHLCIFTPRLWLCLFTLPVHQNSPSV